MLTSIMQGSEIIRKHECFMLLIIKAEKKLGLPAFFPASILVQVELLRLRWRIAPYPVIQLQDQDVISHET